MILGRAVAGGSYKANDRHAHEELKPRAFVAASQKDELYNLDLRPCDAQLFFNYWNKHGTFGTWTQILADFARGRR